MRDYPNMSYCMCENTVLAVNQVYEALENEDTAFIKDLSKSEKAAFVELYRACQDLMMLMDDVEERLEMEEDAEA